MRAIVVITLALVARVAGAEPDEAQAEALFRQGRELLDAGKIPEACAAFDASQKRAPAVTTQLNQAACRERNRQLATAWGLFVEAERQTRDAADAAARNLNRVASSRAAALEPRLSKLVVRVSTEHRVDGLEILVGARVLEPGAWDRALPIDGGDHTITVRAPGRTTWTTSVGLATEADTRTVDVPLLEPAPVAPPPPPKVEVDIPAIRNPVVAPPARSLAPLAFAGAGALAFGGAIALEVWSRDTYADARQQSDADRRRAKWHSANAKRYVAQGLSVAGVGLVATGVWWWLRERKSETRRVRIAPVPGGMVLEGVW